MAELSSKAKYIRLAPGNAFWRTDSSDFMLTALAKKDSTNFYSKTSAIPKDIIPQVNAAVKAGILEFTKTPEYSKNITKESNPIVKQMNKSSLKWSDKGREKSGKALKTPSFSAYNLTVDTNDPVYKSAFKMISLPASNAVIGELTKVLTQITDKKERKALLLACASIETSGKNPAASPRPQVVEYLSDALFDLGERSGISRISVSTDDDEALVEEVVPVKVAKP